MQKYQFHQKVVILDTINQIVMLEVSDNLGAYTDIYKLKNLVICFNFCLFPDYD